MLDEVLETSNRDTHLLWVCKVIVYLEDAYSIFVWGRSRLAYSKLSFIAWISSLDNEGSLRIEHLHVVVRLVRSGFYRWKKGSVRSYLAV